MKTFITAALLICMTSACTQKESGVEVPDIVKENFAKRFPGAENVKWSKESEGEFEAEFMSQAGQLSANFDATGDWLITETEMAATSLPAGVLGTLEKDFAGYKIEEAEMAVTDQGSFYEVKLEQGEKTLVVQIDADGKVLKSEEEKEKGEERD